MKEIKDLNNWRDYVHQRISIAEISALPKLSRDFKAVTIKIPVELFVDTDKPILKCKWKSKGARKSKTTSKRKNKVGESH